MRIAIPKFANRVSPRFDCAQSILLVTVDDGQVSQRQELLVSNWAPQERINNLIKQGVKKVICGAIDRYSVASLQSAGVTVYGWVAGEIEETLSALLRGDLDVEDAVSVCQCRRFLADEHSGEKMQDSGKPKLRCQRRGGRRRRGL